MEGARPYRPDIDGLRAVAILSVLGFHAFPAWVPGGFIGVDIFFVISGFLITGILLSDLERDRFSVRQFYGRRIRRIFPSLVVILVACLSLGLVFLWPGELAHLARHALAGCGFVLNFFLEKETGYFAGNAETKPLLHLWSLAIEEQFYIFWPLLLAFTFKTKRFSGFLIGALFLISLSYNLQTASTDAVVDFYSPFSRFWELLAGALLAWHTFKCPSAPTASRGVDTLSVFGAALLAAGLFGLDKTLSFPGYFALIPVAGAVSLIASGPNALINRVVLSHKGAIGIGLISYPLYLWHWPLLSFAQILSGEDPSRPLRIAMVALSFALAALTYRFVETPIRQKRVTRRLICLLVSALLLVAGLCGLVLVNHGYAERFALNEQEARSLDTDYLIGQWSHDVRAGSCHLQDNDMIDQSADCFSTTRPLLWLWGDSHAAALYPGLEALGQKMGYGLTQTTEAGCPPLFDLGTFKARPNCEAVNQRILAQIGQAKPDILILASAWLRRDYPWTTSTVHQSLKLALQKIKAISPITAIVVVGPTPRWRSPLSSIYRRTLTFKHKAPPERLLRHLDLSVTALDAELSSAAAEDGFTYLSPINVLCDASGCLTRLRNGYDTLTYADDEHLTALASRFVIQAFSGRLIPLAAPASN